MTCPYRGCKGEYGHPSPHLFEAVQIEAFERVAVDRALARIRQRQSLYRLAFDDRRVTRAMLREQAANFEAWLAEQPR